MIMKMILYKVKKKMRLFPSKQVAKKKIPTGMPERFFSNFNWTIVTLQPKFNLKNNSFLLIIF